MRVLVRRLRRLVLIALVLPVVVIAVYGVVPVPVTPLMLIRVAEGEGISRDWVAIDRISPHVARAVIAAEDNMFCRHWGFDWASIGNQVDAAIEGRRPRGASTITMQVAKNILLWPGRDVVRKGLEAILTPVIELLWSKRRIMEVYLNVAEWGNGIYGIEAASRHHFGKDSGELGVQEAARLAAVLPNPRGWSPHGEHAVERAVTLIRRMAQLGPLYHCLS